MTATIRDIFDTVPGASKFDPKQRDTLAWMLRFAIERATKDLNKTESAPQQVSRCAAE